MIFFTTIHKQPISQLLFDTLCIRQPNTNIWVYKDVSNNEVVITRIYANEYQSKIVDQYSYFSFEQASVLPSLYQE